AAIRGAWPGAATTITAAEAPIPDGGIAVGAALAPALPAWYPLRVDHDNDPMRTLIAAVSGLNRAEAAAVQVLAGPASTGQLRQLRRGAAALRAGGRPRSGLSPETWLQVALDVVTELFTPGRGQPASRTGAGTDPGLLRIDPGRDRDARAAVDTLTGPHWEV